MTWNSMAQPEINRFCIDPFQGISWDVPQYRGSVHMSSMEWV